MSASDVEIFEEALEAWGFARRGTIQEAENVPDDRWDFRPHENARTFSGLVRHILEASMMLIGEAADPDGDFTRRSLPEHVGAHAGDLPRDLSPAELREALQTKSDELVRKVREAGVEHMMTPIRRFDGETWKRLTYVFYAASHEDYHRGQLAMYARTMGLVPALTRSIHGPDAK